MIQRGPLGLLALCATLLVACSEGPTGPNVGTLNVSIIGLPEGAAAAVTVEGPDGFSEAVTGNEAFEAVPSGEYIVKIATTTFSEDIFTSAVAVDTLRVTRGRTAAANVIYALASGRIAFSTLGLPTGSTGEVLLEGPGGATRTLEIPAVARGLIAGEWRLSYPRRYGSDGHGYDGATPQTIAVSASEATIFVPVGYSIGTGALAATFNGLPPGVAPRGIVFGTFGIVATLESSGTRTGLDPGQYTVAPQTVFDGDVRYSAASVTQTVDVGLTPRAFSINYLPRSGRLTVVASGLPAAVVVTARVMGPDGLDTTITAGDTLTRLPIGSYIVDGARIPIGGELYSSELLSAVSVVGAQTTVATLQYAPGGSFDVELEAAYAVQAVQRRNGSVPLIANRSALVRVLAKASGPNALTVPARIRIVNGGITTFEREVAASSVGLPYAIDESTFQGSWRVEVPGSAIQPGAVLQVTVDPAETVLEANRSNNTLVRPLDVRNMGNFRARFVPIRFSTGGEAGNVNTSNAESFLQLTRDMLPVAGVDADLRAEYVTAQPRLTTSNGDVWEDVLGELNTLRVLEASGRYYMGIIPVGYTSGIAGIGYLGAPTSLTWDYLPSGSEVLAHELGHNFNRRHAPCGGAGSPDPVYPHVDGTIGAFGWDARRSRLRAPAVKDIMSYCNDPWVSDYTWEGVLGFRERSEPPSPAAPAMQTVLLVRGRITPDGVRLEPTFTLEVAAVLPQAGPHRLELRDSGGNVIYSSTFRGTAIPHATREGTEHFTLAIPTRAFSGRDVAELTVRGGGSSAVERRGPANVRAAPRITMTVEANGSVRVVDADPVTRGMIIRDAATGRIVSIVRGREVLLPAGLGELDVLSSDGIRSSRLRIKPPVR